MSDPYDLEMLRHARHDRERETQMTNPLVYMVQFKGDMQLVLAADGVTERHTLTDNQVASMLESLATYTAKRMRLAQTENTETP